jgi:hypothetical protein
MPSPLKITEDEFGRFLAAYYRGVFPRNATLGNCFLFYYGISGYDKIRLEEDNDKVIEMIIEEFTSSVVF